MDACRRQQQQGESDGSGEKDGEGNEGEQAVPSMPTAARKPEVGALFVVVMVLCVDYVTGKMLVSRA